MGLLSSRLYGHYILTLSVGPELRFLQAAMGSPGRLRVTGRSWQARLLVGLLCGQAKPLDLSEPCPLCKVVTVTARSQDEMRRNAVRGRGGARMCWPLAPSLQDGLRISRVEVLQAFAVGPAPTQVAQVARTAVPLDESGSEAQRGLVTPQGYTACWQSRWASCSCNPLPPSLLCVPEAPLCPGLRHCRWFPCNRTSQALNKAALWGTRNGAASAGNSLAPQWVGQKECPTQPRCSWGYAPKNRKGVQTKDHTLMVPAASLTAAKGGGSPGSGHRWRVGKAWSFQTMELHLSTERNEACHTQ